MTIKKPSKKILSVCIILIFAIATLFGGFALLHSGVRIEQIRIAKVSINGLYLRLHNKFILEVQEIDLSQAMSKPKSKKDFDASNITDYVKYAIWGIAYFEKIDIQRIVLDDKNIASVSYNGLIYSLSFPKLQAVFDVSTKENNMLLDIKYLTMQEPDFSVGGRIIYAPKNKKVGFGLVVLPQNIKDLQPQITQNPIDLPSTASKPNAPNPQNPINTNEQTKLFLQGSSDFKTLKLRAKTTKIKNLDSLAEILQGSEIYPSLKQWLFDALDFESIEIVDALFDISLNPRHFLKSILQNTTAQAQVQNIAYFLPASLPNAMPPQSLSAKSLDSQSSPNALPTSSNGAKSSKKSRFPTPFIAKKMQVVMKNGKLNLIPESFGYDSLSLAGTNLIFSLGEKPSLHIALNSPKVALSQAVHSLLKYFNISLPIDNIKGDIKAQVGISIDLSKKKNTQNLAQNEAQNQPQNEIAQNELESQKDNTSPNLANPPKSTPTNPAPLVIVRGNISAKDAIITSSNIDFTSKSALVLLDINPSAKANERANTITIESKNTRYENLFDIDTKTTIDLDTKKLKTSLFVHSLRVSTNPQINEKILNPQNIQKREEFLKELKSHKTTFKPIYLASNNFIKSDIEQNPLAHTLFARLDSSLESSSAESSDFVMPKPLEHPQNPSFIVPSTNAPSPTQNPTNTTPQNPNTAAPSINLPTLPKKEKETQKKQNTILEKTGDMLLPKTSKNKSNTAPQNTAEQLKQINPNDNDDGDDIIESPKSNLQPPTKSAPQPKAQSLPKSQNPQKQELNPKDSKPTKPDKSNQKDSKINPKNPTKPNQSSGKIITKGVELDFSKPMSEATTKAKILELIKAQNESVFTYDIFRADKSSLPQIDIDMDFANEEISINIPSLQTYAKMLHSQIVLAVRDFTQFAPYSPLMKYLGLHSGSAIVHLRSADDVAFEVQIKDYPTFLLKKDKTPLKDFTFQGQYKDKKLRVKSTPQGLFSFESYDNTMLAKFNNIDIDIDALLSSEIPAIKEAFSTSDEKKAVFTKSQIMIESEFLRQKRRYERQNGIKPHIIAIEAQNIVGFYKQIILPFNDFNAKIRDDRISADATYGNGIANIDIIHGNTLFKAGNFSADFLNRVIGRKIVEGGLFEASGIYQNDIFQGEISMQNTSFKGFAIVQNVIGLIDTIPSLVMFRSPGLSAKGYEVKNGKILLGLNSEYIALESIDLIGKTMDTKGSGVIEINSGEIDIGLSISTLKSLTSVLNKIPIVGYLILGKDGKITTQVSIEGTLENPQSQISLAQDIVSAPLTIIKRAFTPVDMLIDEIVKSID